MKRFLFTALLVLGLLNMAAAQNEPINIGYVLWDSEIASTHVLAAAIEEELGYEVNLVAVDAGPLYSGLAQGDLDVTVSASLPAVHAHYWEAFGPDLLDLGPNLDGTSIGLVAPTYVEADSIGELNDYVDEFNGEIIGIEPGAGIMSATEEAIEAYDLDYGLVDSSDASMMAALDRAVARDEWIVITGWEPHWMWAAYDLKYLDDPKLAFGEAGSIHTIVNPEFAENAPADLLAFLDNFYWTPLDMGEVMLSIHEDGLDPWEAARNWIADNQETVQSWLP
jgi:glycine betaine/proline transport system substrate-binding protein